MSNAPTPEPESLGDGKAVWQFPRHRADVDLHHRGHRRGVPRRVRDLRAASTARSRSATTAASRWSSTWTPTSWSKLTSAGLRVLRGGLRLPLPVPQVRPALRAGVQHGRDGERRRRHAARRVPPAQPPGRVVLRVPLLGDPARDGAHVVRRPRHHEVVGRPVAQRVLRRVGLLPRRGRGHRVRRVLDRASPTPARTGRCARTSCRAPTRSRPTTTTCRPSRSTSTGSPTPRAPRCSSSWSPGSASTTSSSGCAPTSSATPSATRSSATCSAALEESSGRELDSWAKEWLQTSGVNTLVPRLRARRRRRLHAPSRSSRRATVEHPTLRRHRLGIGLYDRVPNEAGVDRLVRRTTVEVDVEGETHRDRRAGRASASRTCCCSTTATSPTPRSGSTSARSRPWSTASRCSTTHWRGRCAGAPPGT